MKKIIIKNLLIFIALLSSGLLMATPDGYTLNCTVKGKDSGMLFLDRFDMQAGTGTRDSAAIINGKCTFRGNLKDAFYAAISDGDIKNYGNPNATGIFIDASVMEVTLEWGNFKNILIKGSPLNDVVKKYSEIQKPLQEKRDQLNKIINSDADSLVKAKANSEMTLLRREFDVCDHNFIMENLNSYYSAYLVDMKKSQMPVEKIISYYNALATNVKESSWGKSVKGEIDLINSLMPGKPAPEFSSIDINGKKLSLSDFRGKYVLVDFWASWCVPCRKGNPHLKELYKKYNGEGFEVICVADDDSNHSKWRDAVAKDGIEMFHHILRGLKRVGNLYDRSNSIADRYAVHLLPTKYLIDKEGKIIGKVDEDQLDKKLVEIFGF
ncbi:MAG: thioredoxin [Bacteroidetes bacterium HGW-Bacteroidetes-8]|jgi:thiol-disulfide isomerase/thioredoxin|nr:MAG: thioredoxin [Bacteroidetes bacterium HGW-Bacteroidetes-8]